jgi:hypothetical protein
MVSWYVQLNSVSTFLWEDQIVIYYFFSISQSLVTGSYQSEGERIPPFVGNTYISIILRR